MIHLVLPCSLRGVLRRFEQAYMMQLVLPGFLEGVPRLFDQADMTHAFALLSSGSSDGFRDFIIGIVFTCFWNLEKFLVQHCCSQLLAGTLHCWSQLLAGTLHGCAQLRAGTLHCCSQLLAGTLYCCSQLPECGALLIDPIDGVREYFGESVPLPLLKGWKDQGNVRAIAQIELSCKSFWQNSFGETGPGTGVF